jgi:hypothetical protein
MRGWFFESELITSYFSSEGARRSTCLLSSQRGRLLAEGFKGMKVDSGNRNQLLEFDLLENLIQIGFKSLKAP